jgi:Zn-dependent protease
VPLAGGSIQLVRISGIRIGVSPSWFIVLFILIWILSGYFQDVLQGTQTQAFTVAVICVLLFFASLIAHELGHAIVARRQGIEIAGIDLWLLGGVAKMRQDTTSPGREFNVAAAGPAVSLLLALGFGAAAVGLAGADEAWSFARYRLVPELTATEAMVLFLAQMNAILFVFNLIPAFPLDGGRIARSLIWKLTGDRNKATRAAGRVGQGFGWLLVAYAAFELMRGASTLSALWLGIIGWFVITAARSAVVSTAFTERLEGITVADVMDTQPVAMPAGTTALAAQEEFFLRYGWPWFPVVEEDGRFLGLVRQEAVDGAVGAGRPALAARELVDGDAGEWGIPAEEPIESLLGSERLRRVGALMAVDGDGRLAGVVTVEQVRRAVTAVLPGP